MKAAQIAFFIFAINIGFWLLNVAYSPYAFAYGDQTFNFTSGEYETLTNVNMSYYDAPTSIDRGNYSTPGNMTLGDTNVGGFDILAMIGGAGQLLGFFTGMHGTITMLIMALFGSMPWADNVAWAITAFVDVIMVYGFIQFLLGRGGRTIE
jgi:hypothetical protein